MLDAAQGQLHGHEDFTSSRVANIRQEIEKHRLAFLERMMQRCLEIESLQTFIDNYGLDKDALEAIALRAHKTAGVAATFGFNRLGELALEAEKHLRNTFSDADWNRTKLLLEDFMQEIELAIDEAHPELSI